MHSLVVQSHPLDDSLSAALCDEVAEGLRRGGDPHRVVRLGLGERPTDDDVVTAHRLILVYPTWWGGQPASMLDWLGDLVERNVALASIRSLAAVTSCGSSIVENRLQGEWGRRYLEKRIVPRCAEGTELEWLALYRIDRQRQSTVTAFVRDIRERFTAAPSR